MLGGGGGAPVKVQGRERTLRLPRETEAKGKGLVQVVLGGMSWVWACDFRFASVIFSHLKIAEIDKKVPILAPN